MGRRGPQPKPAAIREIEGSKKNAPVKNPMRPTLAVEIGQPSWLKTERAVAVYRKVATELTRLGMLAEIDIEGIAAYAQAYSDMVDASEQLQAEGLTQTTANGIRKHPAHAVFLDNWKAMLSAAQHYGFTPAARARIEAPNGVSDDAFEAEFFELKVAKA